MGVVAAHRLPIDDVGLGAQTGHGVDDQREAVCQVIARTAVEPHTLTVRQRLNLTPVPDKQKGHSGE